MRAVSQSAIFGCCVFLVCTIFISSASGFLLTSTYEGNGLFRVLYEGRIPIAIALDVTLPDGLATDSSLCTTPDYYNYYPDWIYEQIGNSQGMGNPLAKPHDPGSLSGAVSFFTVSMGALQPYLVTSDLLAPYDLNEDGKVDFLDGEILSYEWLWHDSSASLMADFNRDQVVDIVDLGMMNGMQWLDSSTAGVFMTIQVLDYDPDINYAGADIRLNTLRGGMYSVPEPATMMLLGLGGLVVALKRNLRIRCGSWQG